MRLLSTPCTYSLHAHGRMYPYEQTQKPMGLQFICACTHTWRWGEYLSPPHSPSQVCAIWADVKVQQLQVDAAKGGHVMPHVRIRKGWVRGGHVIMPHVCMHKRWVRGGRGQNRRDYCSAIEVIWLLKPRTPSTKWLSRLGGLTNAWRASIIVGWRAGCVGCGRRSCQGLA